MVDPVVAVERLVFYPERVRRSYLGAPFSVNPAKQTRDRLKMKGTDLPPEESDRLKRLNDELELP